MERKISNRIKTNDLRTEIKQKEGVHQTPLVSWLLQIQIVASAATIVFEIKICTACSFAQHDLNLVDRLTNRAASIRLTELIALLIRRLKQQYKFSAVLI